MIGLIPFVDVKVSELGFANQINQIIGLDVEVDISCQYYFFFTEIQFLEVESVDRRIKNILGNVFGQIDFTRKDQINVVVFDVEIPIKLAGFELAFHMSVGVFVPLKLKTFDIGGQFGPGIFSRKAIAVAFTNGCPQTNFT